MSLNEIIENCIKIFNFNVKSEFQKLLEVQVVSVKKDNFFNKNNNLIVKHSSEGSIYISECKIELTKIDDFEKSSIINILDISKVIKLKNDFLQLKKMVPVLIPINLCVARVYESNPHNSSLADILIVDTISLLSYLEKNIIDEDLIITTDFLDKNNISYKYFKTGNQKEKMLLENTFILYESQNKNESEISQMQNFIIDAELSNLGNFVEMLYYNSENNYCILEICDNYDKQILNQIKQIAKKNINRYFILNNGSEVA
ncbi:hypothetical protein [Arcobacter sp. CECT 8985]|uniref:hypothetical protein n=1 Tax=Arcobacter sp. CECT 8985 TaxID=1935424 RepID=UPI00100A7724|nr:hypothetical protein [Arcobacter sp. CECT 8985]RXJ87122.1 hypothetical protein CRU93_05115 [Arcobacter sp. CECT 8985]